MSPQIAAILAGVLYDFGGFITTREQRLVASASDDASPTAETIAEFLKMRGLADAEAVVSWPEYALMVHDQALAEQRQTYEAVARGRLRLIRELDVALNGAAGAAQQASMSDLIAQVTRQQCVQIANLPDGMRINFRAPDGMRATLNLQRLFASPEHLTDVPDLVATIRAAIADYPVAGAAPAQREQQFGLYVDTMTEAQRERAVKVHEHFDEPFDSHPDDVAAQHEAMNLYVRTGELRRVTSFLATTPAEPLPAECPISSDGKHCFLDEGCPCMACGVPL